MWVGLHIHGRKGNKMIVTKSYQSLGEGLMGTHCTYNFFVGRDKKKFVRKKRTGLIRKDRNSIHSSLGT